MYTKPRSINIFLLNGEPDGVRTAEIAMSTIMGIAFRRNLLGTVKKEFPVLESAGVYVLLGGDENEKPFAYIGESENVSQRLRTWDQAPSEKLPGEWSEALVFVSKDDNVTKSHARFVEARLIQDAKKNPHWITNIQEPQQAGKLPKSAEHSMIEFAEQAKILSRALGSDVFKPVAGKPAATSGDETATPESDKPATGEYSPLFRMSGAKAGYNATAAVYLPTGEIEVMSGSTVAPEPSDTIPTPAKNAREQLKADGVLVSWVFERNYRFPSPSMAAAVVSGYSVNGRQAWKLADDSSKTYDDWEKARENGAV